MSTQQNSSRARVEHVADLGREVRAARGCARPARAGPARGSAACRRARSVSILASSMSIANTGWPSLGEAGGGDQADPADPDDADRRLLVRVHVPEASARVASSRIEVAIESIWPSSSDCEQRVVDPVGGVLGLEADQPQAVAVVEEQVVAAVDRPRLARVRRGSARRSSRCPRRRSTRREPAAGLRDRRPTTSCSRSTRPCRRTVDHERPRVVVERSSRARAGSGRRSGTRPSARRSCVFTCASWFA